MSKIQSESNSQLAGDYFIISLSCDQYVKDTIWKQFTTLKGVMYFWKMLWPICQRYNLKAIHNNASLTLNNSRVVTNMSKIQSESHSQPYGPKLLTCPCCDQYVKDTIWKQFTTKDAVKAISLMLWPICQRYNLNRTFFASSAKPKQFTSPQTYKKLVEMLWPVCQRYNLNRVFFASSAKHMQLTIEMIEIVEMLLKLDNPYLKK